MGAASLTPEQSRAQDKAFVTGCSLAGLRERLPLSWPTPLGTPPSPKRRYRSHYVYLGWQDLEDPRVWEHLSEFDLLLRLVDFGGLRPVLAQLLGWKSGRGWAPFDPLSFFLLVGWQITHCWTRSQTLANLRSPRYADYARFFGFGDSVFPTEGGVRYFLTTLGRNSDAGGQTADVENGQDVIQVAIQHLNRLIAQSVALLRQAGVLSPQAWGQALICPDGQLHDAASQRRCLAVGESCYQATTPEHPRPCRAKEKGQHGCECDTVACGQVCRYATPRDPQARFVWYTGSNQPQSSPNRLTPPNLDQPEDGEGRYGYRSLPLRLADPQRRFSLTLLDDLRPANQHEEVPAAALLLQLHTHYPDLCVDAVAGDAGLGLEVFLHTVYAHLHARRVIDRRRHETDADKTQWPLRGYDDHGRPVCAYGYAFSANGFDRERQRHKWVCDQACLKGEKPQIPLSHVTYPPPDCPYQATQHPHGRVINLAERFPDGSIRLARDVPMGSPTWKALYHRGRNAVEGRNATFEGWGFKRFGVYGQPRAKALTFQADVWDNLTTLARLVREATLASLVT